MWLIFAVSTVEKKDGKMATTKQDFLNNPTWVKRIEEFFNVRDVNKNGYVELRRGKKWGLQCVK